MVEWPGRGNRGAGSQERKNADKLVKSSSMTAVAVDAGKYYKERTQIERFAGRDADSLLQYIDDRSITKEQHRDLFGQREGFLIQGNPFAMPDDLKRSTSRSKRIVLDEDSARYDKRRK